MTRSQAAWWLAAVLAGSWWGWTRQRQVHARALDLLNAHFGDFEPVGVTATEGW